MTRLKIARLLVWLVIVTAACSPDRTDEQASGTSPTDPTEPRGFTCQERTRSGCHMVAMSFESPVTLKEIESMTADWPGHLHGVWRSEWICLQTEGSIMNAENPASRFAYLGAATIPERVSALAPPPTDGGSSQALWQQRIEALERLSDDLVGAAMWLPTDWDVPTAGSVAATQVVPHRFTYGDAAVLYIGEPGYQVDPVVELDFPWVDVPPDCSPAG